MHSGQMQCTVEMQAIQIMSIVPVKTVPLLQSSCLRCMSTLNLCCDMLQVSCEAFCSMTGVDLFVWSMMPASRFVCLQQQLTAFTHLTNVSICFVQARRDSCNDSTWRRSHTLSSVCQVHKCSHLLLQKDKAGCRQVVSADHCSHK